MTLHLDGCWAKVERAEEHFSQLQMAVREFFDLDPYGVVTKPDPYTGEQVAQIRVSEDPPFRLSAIIGDLAHNLRSALDHLAWQLVIDGGGTPKTGPGGTQFPVFWQADKYESSGWRKVKGASEATMKAIKRLQPYQRGDDFASHPL